MENGEVIPLEHEENDQSSTPTELINNNEYQLGLICIDILVHTPMQNSKRTGIEYLLFGTNYIKKIVQYYKILTDNAILFEEMVGWNS